MADIVGAAIEVLKSLEPHEMMPLNYHVLAERAWTRLGWIPEDSEIARQSAEDLRTAADSGRRGLAYLSEKRVGKTHPNVCSVYLEEWVAHDQARLFNDEQPIPLLGVAPTDWFEKRWRALITAKRGPRMLTLEFEGLAYDLVVTSTDDWGKYRLRAEDKKRITVLENARRELCGWWWIGSNKRTPAQYRSEPLSRLFVRLNCALYRIDHNALRRAVGK